MPNCRAALVAEVILVKTLEGKGVVGDAYREVYWYYSKAGELLALNDPAGQMTLMHGIVYKSKASKEAYRGQ